MSRERHERLSDLFRQLCDRPAEEQARLLDQLCADDPILRRDAEALLARDLRDPEEASADDDANKTPGHASPGLPATFDRLGRYRIVRPLGRGGMGLVYLAEQDVPKRLVALKVLEPHHITPHLEARFALEADALARLQHPHIAQIYDTGVAQTDSGPRSYLAMEYVEGHSLLEHAASHQLDDAARLKLITQLCEAVHHAHQKGVIHRDLKPANILVTSDHQLKVLDFGVARLTDSDLRASTLRTHVGDLIGTVPYMSPEQAAGNAKELDTRSDVYALGVIGYELLSGHLPYDLTQRMLHEALRVVQSQPPERLSRWRPRLGGDMETILGKALEKEPALRYQSASELAEDIRRFLGNEPILARPPSLAYQLRKFARRHAGLVASVAMAGVILVAGLVGMMGLSWRLARERDSSVMLKQQAEEARAQAEAARQQAEHSLAVQSAISGFLQDVFAAGSPYVGRADMTVAEALDLASKRADESLSHLPEAALAVRMRLSDTYYSQGKMAQALKEMRAALAQAQTHPATPPGYLAMVHASLGQLLLESGDPQAARSHLQQARDLCEKDELRNHPARALTLVNLGALLLSGNENDAAWPLLQEALELRLKEFGRDHPYTMTVRNNLAVAAGRLGRLSEAESLSRDNVASHRRVLGDKHPNTITGIYNLADLLREMGKLDESEENFQLCCKLGLEHLPSRHFLLGQYRSGYGEMLRCAKRYQEAETELTLGYEILEEQLGKEHPHTLRALDRMIQLYIDWDRPKEAETWRARRPPESVHSTNSGAHRVGAE